MIEYLPEELYEELHPTGSNYICNPPVTNTDIDYVILTNEFERLHKWLLSDGWTRCGNKEYELNPDEFVAYRQDEFNYIVIQNEEVYGKWLTATEKAKELNLTNKADRIKLFNEVLGRKPKEEKKATIHPNYKAQYWFSDAALVTTLHNTNTVLGVDW